MVTVELGLEFVSQLSLSHHFNGAFLFFRMTQLVGLSSSRLASLDGPDGDSLKRILRLEYEASDVQRARVGLVQHRILAHLQLNASAYAGYSALPPAEIEEMFTERPEFLGALAPGFLQLRDVASVRELVPFFSEPRREDGVAFFLAAMFLRPDRTVLRTSHGRLWSSRVDRIVQTPIPRGFELSDVVPPSHVEDYMERLPVFNPDGYGSSGVRIAREYAAVAFQCYESLLALPASVRSVLLGAGLFGATRTHAVGVSGAEAPCLFSYHGMQALHGAILSHAWTTGERCVLAGHKPSMCVLSVLVYLQSLCFQVLTQRRYMVELARGHPIMDGCDFQRLSLIGHSGKAYPANPFNRVDVTCSSADVRGELLAKFCPKTLTLFKSFVELDCACTIRETIPSYLYKCGRSDIFRCDFLGVFGEQPSSAFLSSGFMVAYFQDMAYSISYLRRCFRVNCSRPGRPRNTDCVDWRSSRGAPFPLRKRGRSDTRTPPPLRRRGEHVGGFRRQVSPSVLDASSGEISESPSPVAVCASAVTAREPVIENISPPPGVVERSPLAIAMSEIVPLDPRCQYELVQTLSIPGLGEHLAMQAGLTPPGRNVLLSGTTPVYNSPSRPVLHPVNQPGYGPFGPVTPQAWVSRSPLGAFAVPAYNGSVASVPPSYPLGAPWASPLVSSRAHLPQSAPSLLAHGSAGMTPSRGLDRDLLFRAEGEFPSFPSSLSGGSSNLATPVYSETFSPIYAALRTPFRGSPGQSYLSPARGPGDPFRMPFPATPRGLAGSGYFSGALPTAAETSSGPQDRVAPSVSPLLDPVGIEIEEPRELNEELQAGGFA